MIVIKNVFVYVAVFFITATTLLFCSFLPTSDTSSGARIATKDEVSAVIKKSEKVSAVSCVKEQKPQVKSQEKKENKKQREERKEEKQEQKKKEQVFEEEYVERLTNPEYTNAFYYSDSNPFYSSGYEMPNCTCYAWGRAYEILNEEPSLSLSDAKDWFDYNKENGIYEYGDDARIGAVACWDYENGGCGHVAVVEKIEGDTITYSNSAWSGEEFYITQCSVDNKDMYDGWIFEGYIYLI